MFRFQSHIIEKDSGLPLIVNYNHKRSISLFFGLGTFLLISFPFFSTVSSYIIFACISAVIAFVLFLLLTQLQVEGNIKNTQEYNFILDSDQVIIQRKKIELKGLKNLQISISGYYGQREGWNRIYSGRGNFISFTNGDTENNIEFYIKSEAHKNELGQLLYIWHEKMILKEKYQGHSTYGLCFLSYKEIQKLKATRENDKP